MHKRDFHPGIAALMPKLRESEIISNLPSIDSDRAEDMKPLRSAQEALAKLADEYHFTNGASTLKMFESLHVGKIGEDIYLPLIKLQVMQDGRNYIAAYKGRDVDGQYIAMDKLVLLEEGKQVRGENGAPLEYRLKSSDSQESSGFMIKFSGAIPDLYIDPAAAKEKTPAPERPQKPAIEAPDLDPASGMAVASIKQAAAAPLIALNVAKLPDQFIPQVGAATPSETAAIKH